MLSFSKSLCLYLCNTSKPQIFDHVSTNKKSVFVLTNCFQQSFVVLPLYFLFLIYCSHQIGFYGFRNFFKILKLYLKKLNLCLCLLFPLFVVVCTQTILILIKNSPFISAITSILKLWTIVFYLIFLILQSFVFRGKISYKIKFFILTISIVNISECLTCYFENEKSQLSFIFLVILSCFWIFHCICLSLQTFQLEFASVLLVNDETYEDSNTLLCDESHSFFSQFFFNWVSPLLDKGTESTINSSEDLFQLPKSLSSSSSNKIVDDYLLIIDRKSLLRIIFSLIKWKLIRLAFFKLMGDFSIYLFPIFLKKLLFYLDTDHSKSDEGFLIVSFLFMSTFLNALFVSYFNFHMSKLSLYIRTFLINIIYHKLFSIRAHTATQSGTGKILNLANTDVERVVNLIPSIYQFFSLPIQLLITLYLLYKEINLVFLSAIVFIVLLIPINKWICNKIGTLSQQMMKWKDERIKLMSQILKGIRAIKTHAWECLFIEKVLQLREQEIKYLKYRKYLDALCVYFWATTPVIISSLVFSLYIFLNGAESLDASRVFTCLALLGMLIMPLNAFPWVLNGLMEALVSLRRIKEFLVLAQLDASQNYNQISDPDVFFNFDHCSFEFKKDDNIHNNDQESFKLLDLNVKINKHSFIAVIGKVGSGKSSFLKAFINELQRTSGVATINESLFDKGIGYVSQEPWLQNTSIRENILFGKEYDPSFYHRVIDSCELIFDFQTLINGDQTLVGDQGTILSGGQRSRICLARALYQNFDVYLIDEPFSSIDRHVAKKIFQKCFQKILKKKCLILVTNHYEYLTDVDEFLYFESGKIVKKIDSISKLNEKFVSVHATIAQIDNNDDSHSIKDEISFVENLKEERELGVVKLDVYLSYAQSLGFVLFAFIILFICLMQISKVSSDFFLSIWTRNKETSKTLTYLYIFIGIGISNSFITLIRAFLFAYGGVKAAINVHESLLNSIFKSSLQFFDLTSFGIIMNRFSSDTFNVDDALPFTLNIFLSQLSALFVGMFVTIYGTIWIVFIMFPLAIPYYLIQKYFRASSRELKRLASVSLSPVYSQLDDTIQGLLTIRSFAQNQRFKDSFYQKIDIYNRIQYSINAIQQWLNLRLQFIGALITSFVAFIAVLIHYFRDTTDHAEISSMVGLSMVYSLSLTSLLNGSVQSFTQTELDLISVERIMQIFNSMHKFYENSFSAFSSELGINWPMNGSIIFQDVSMRYRNDLEFALKKISFEVPFGQHVAIVGRTGSGKSSIFQCLLRLIEIDSGSISIDGIDINTINLKFLRSKIYIIPQDAFLYDGTIRENIDPFHQFSDDEIWTALYNCNINILVDSFGGLDKKLSENGKDLSVGQRQLFCLARAVLNKSKVLCMDEITANIDPESASVLQELMNTIFKNSTVLHIAHKIDAILNYDRVIEMNDGCIMNDCTLDFYLASQS